MSPAFKRACLRFYFITDDRAPHLAPVDQVAVALAAGATCVQYRNKNFSLDAYDEVVAVRDLCRRHAVPFLVNDHILLARAVAADGVHVGQEDDGPAAARRILGPGAIVGVSVSTRRELAATDLTGCDYIGSGPVFGTRTKADAKAVRGLDGLARIVAATPLPVVAIGGIGPQNAAACLARGAAGVAVISAVSRAPDPLRAARRLAAACGCRPRSGQ